MKKILFILLILFIVVSIQFILLIPFIVGFYDPNFADPNIKVRTGRYNPAYEENRKPACCYNNNTIDDDHKNGCFFSIIKVKNPYFSGSP